MGACPRQGQAELPTPQSTASYWLQQPSEALLGHCTTPDLPATADVVVIGSGITGAFAARELVESGRQVVMLEAREACWGATGRNGGHCRPAILGEDPEVSRFELATYHYLRDLVAKEAVPCDWHSVGNVLPLPSEEVVSAATHTLETLRRRDPALAEEMSIITDPEELTALRVRAPGAVVQRTAAKVWPYKLVAWVLEGLVRDAASTSRGDKGVSFNLQTSTPATHLQQLPSGSWTVHTPRGQIAAQHVLLATNAYTSRLLPQMANLIVPVRAQICALTPPKDGRALDKTYVWVADAGDDYLVQRDDGSKAGGALILGGERLCTRDKGEGISRDDTVDKVVGKRLRQAMASALKLNEPGVPEEEELVATYEWTGITGFSADERPWVGAVPARLARYEEGGEDGPGGSGLWISAGYSGHGMPSAARCGVAVAQEMVGKKDGIEVPGVYRITEERIRGILEKEEEEGGKDFVYLDGRREVPAWLRNQQSTLTRF